MKCRNCGAELENGVLFCRECGDRVSNEEIRICTECGATVPVDAVFCQECGRRLEGSLINDKVATTSYVIDYYSEAETTDEGNNGKYIDLESGFTAIKEVARTNPDLVSKAKKFMWLSLGTFISVFLITTIILHIISG